MAGFKINLKSKNSRGIHIIRMTAVYLAMLVFCDVYFSSFKISVDLVSIAFILIPIVIFSYFMVCVQKHCTVRLVIFLVVLAALSGCYYEVITNGMDFFAYCYTKISDAAGDYDNIPETVVSNELLVLMFVILIVFSMIFAAILLAQRGWILPLVILLMPAILVSCAGYMPSIFNVCKLLVAGIIYMFCYHKRDGRETIVALTGAMAVLLIMIAVSLFLASKIEQYKETNKDKYLEVRADLKNLDSISFDKIISKKIGERGNYTKGGVGKGDLRNLTTCKPEGSKELEVTLSYRPSSSIYLKAFVGTTYTGEKWEKLDKKALDKLNKFAGSEEKQRELLNTPFHKMEEISKTNENDSSGGYYSLEQENIEINILNNYSDIGYFPYFADISSEKGINQDSYIEGKGRKEYSYSFYKSEDADLLMIDFQPWNYVLSDLDIYGENIMSDESKIIYMSNTDLWEEYSEFVSEEYTGYPEELTGLTDFCRLFQETSSDTVLSDEIDSVFKYRMEYTLNPGIKPDDKDFVEYFLESGKGFCVHFASAATLIYRKFGYPARYVEGYAIPQSAFKIQPDGTYKAVVTDRMAHAWCEVFNQNLGWIVREHTLSSNENGNFSSVNSGGSSQTETGQQTTKPDETKNETTTIAKETESSTNSISGNSNSGTGDSLKSRNDKDRKAGWRTVLFWILRICMAGIIIMMLCIGQCSVRINHKIHRFRKKKNNIGIRCMYNEIVEICRFCGLRTAGKTEFEIFEQMSIKFSELSYEEWQWIYDCVLHAAFSHKEMDKAANRKMYQLMSKFKKKIWSGLSFRKKFIFKIVRAM